MKVRFLLSTWLLMVLTVGVAQAQSLTGLWEFNSNYSATVGNDIQQSELFDASNNANSGWSLTNATIGGQSAQVAQFSDGAFARIRHGCASDGGTDANRFTIIMDVFFDSASVGSSVSLYNANIANANDGDAFLNLNESPSLPGGGLGVLGDYTDTGVTSRFQLDTWHRIAFSVNGIDDTNIAGNQTQMRC